MSAPVICPALLSLVCPSKYRAGRATQEEQAEAAGVSRRHFIRIVKQNWDRWDIPTAVRWCAHCGVDFWALSTTRVDPKALRLTEWTLDDPRVREAVILSCRASQVEPTPERLRQIVDVLKLASQGYGSSVGTTPGA